MKFIEDLIVKLEKEKNKENIISILQEINKTILTKYMIKIEDIYIYPIEVEAYYNQEEYFNDTCVHNHIKQKNRFGKLYFHRISKSSNTIKNGNRGGIDICLSKSNSYALGILIRSAKINLGNKIICGPGSLFKYISEYSNITPIDIENSKNILFRATNDLRNQDSDIFIAERFGIGKSDYKYELLRSFIDLEDIKNVKLDPKIKGNVNLAKLTSREFIIYRFLKNKHPDLFNDVIKRHFNYNPRILLEKLESNTNKKQAYQSVN